MKRCLYCGGFVVRKIMAKAKYCSGDCRLKYNNAKRPPYHLTAESKGRWRWSKNK
jgi:hypothetical protein